MSAHYSEPERWIHFDCDIQKSAFHGFSLPVQVKEQGLCRVALHNGKSTEQRQMPIRIGTAHVLGERIFKTCFLQTFLKLLELIGRPHLGDAEYIRMNFFDDPDQRFLFTFRFRPKSGLAALPPVHFQIVFDIVMGKSYRFLANSGPGQPEQAHCTKAENLPCRHKKARSGKAGPGL